MNRIPILIQGSGGIGGSIISGGVEYILTWDADNTELVLTNSETTDEQRIKLTGVGSGGSSQLLSELVVSKAVGGIVNGKSYAEGTSLEQIIRDMLNPVENPVFTAPSATLTATGDKLLEIGSTLNTTMTLAFNQGAITPAYGTNGKRAGTATGYILNGGAEQTANTFSVTVSETNKTFQGTVKYAEGVQPLNSEGNPFSTPLAAGSVNSNTINYEFVNAFWSNAANIENIVKEALISKSVKQKVFSFPAQTLTDVETFDVPASWNVTGVQVFNTLSNQYENCAAEFTVTDVKHGDVDYKRYSDNRGYEAGPRKIKVLWS